MKYLKKYKLFESITKSDVIEKLGFDPELILDLFVPLQDIGIDIRYIGYTRTIEKDLELYEDRYIFQYDHGVFKWEEEMPSGFEYVDSNFSWDDKLPNKFGYIEFAIIVEKSSNEEYKELIEELITKLKSIFSDVSHEYWKDEVIYFKNYKNKR